MGIRVPAPPLMPATNVVICSYCGTPCKSLKCASCGGVTNGPTVNTEPYKTDPLPRKPLDKLLGYGF